MDKNEWLMGFAEQASKKSKDAQTKVGAVLVKNDSDAIIATGYNGFARGANDSILPNTRPDKYQYMIHAEENLVANCARHGINMSNCRIYCTLSPCTKCMRLLFQCGITEVIVKEFYHEIEEIKKMKDINIKIEQVENYWRLKYEI